MKPNDGTFRKQLILCNSYESGGKFSSIGMNCVCSSHSSMAGLWQAQIWSACTAAG